MQSFFTPERSLPRPLCSSWEDMEKQLEVDAKADEDVYDKMAWHSAVQPEIYLEVDLGNILGCNIRCKMLGPPTQKRYTVSVPVYQCSGATKFHFNFPVGHCPPQKI